MDKIDNETLSLFNDPDDLIGFIALHRYGPVNGGLLESPRFKELPQYVADVIYILDFETMFDIEGLFFFLENSPGKHFPETVAAFERTGNTELAGYLKKVKSLMDARDVSIERLQNETLENILQWDEKRKDGEMRFDLEETFPELRREIEEVEKELYPLMDERDYWDRVKSSLKPHLKA